MDTDDSNDQCKGNIDKGGQHEIRSGSPLDPSMPFGELVPGSRTVTTMTFRRVVEWFISEEPGKLRLPPIQRSLVWRNDQILNYWDSLMRGYPAGMMMVKRATGPGRNEFGTTKPLTEPAFHLFDGQQRICSLLLGLDRGPSSKTIRLWIDLGRQLTDSDEWLFALRVNSTGQPYGYRPEKPNEKPSVDERNVRHKDWPTEKDGKTPKPPDTIFKGMASDRPGALFSSVHAVPLSDIMAGLMARRPQKEIEDELRGLAGAGTPVDIARLLKSLQKALDAEIIIKLVDDVLSDEVNYRRFFTRLGQGGTRLSDDELTYSLIKDRYPYVHDRVTEIVEDKGRLASEVDLVLGALRVAQALSPVPETLQNDERARKTEEHARASRPTPGRVQVLDGVTKSNFLSMLPDGTAPRRLQTTIKCLKDGLLYNLACNPKGLPSMLLARVPRDLLDVLVLFTFKRGETQAWVGEDRTNLIAFTLHWLLFIADSPKAAYQTFFDARHADWRFTQNSIAALLRDFEASGVARRAPRNRDWTRIECDAGNNGFLLLKWEERFSGRGSEDKASPAAALQVLSTHPELIKRALIWIQRRYVTESFPNYDPTSARDDDLPFDLDHAIPHELFGFWWTDGRMPLLPPAERARFKDLRHTVGNSLGNYRWLAAADNRARGMNKIEEAEENNPPLDDHIDRPSWNTLFNEDNAAKRWSEADVATFQRLIDRRTLSLTKMIMVESGLAILLDHSDHLNTPSITQPDS